jgi:hypothetical protein
MPKSFQIEGDQDDIILRFRRGLVDPSTLARLLDYVELASIRDASDLQPEEASDLAHQIDAAVWERVKDKYVE